MFMPHISFISLFVCWLVVVALRGIRQKKKYYENKSKCLPMTCMGIICLWTRAHNDQNDKNSTKTKIKKKNTKFITQSHTMNILYSVGKTGKMLNSNI